MTNILIVEDDPMVALINRKYLEKIGNMSIYGPVTTEEEIIKILNSKKIDLILLDVFLPQKNGVEILKSLRSKDYLVDVIMVTAANSSKELEIAFSYGATDYLVKPFEFNRFEEAFNKFKLKNKLIHKSESLTQQEIDSIYKSRNKEENIELPKGLNNRTLEKVEGFLEKNAHKIWTIREIANELNISNVTIKKYMDYLEDTSFIEVEVTSGNVGRPELKYRIMGK
ncbi:MAG: response regulator [Peptostreptococcaceae bacterium]